jgi:hypothetical protein
MDPQGVIGQDGSAVVIRKNSMPPEVSGACNIVTPLFAEFLRRF